MEVFFVVFGVVAGFILAEEWHIRRQAKAPEPLQRRVVWSESDARARQRIADQWKPQRSAVGPWSITKGETASSTKPDQK